MATESTPVVFVHGLWLHASSWDAWVEKFKAAGYEPSAPGWPGDSDTVEETRRQSERVAGYGIDAVVDHYAELIGSLETKPIAIGHSFGGLIVQRLLGQDLAAAAVAIDPAPIKGVLSLPPSALKVASIALRNPANKKRAVSLTHDQFRYGFGNQLSAEESEALFEKWTIPSPGRPLFEAAFENFSRNSPAKVATDNQTRGPAPRHRRRQGSHRPGLDQPLHGQAVQELVGDHRPEGVPEARALADDRQRLGRGRRRRPCLAEGARPLGRNGRSGKCGAHRRRDLCPEQLDRVEQLSVRHRPDAELEQEAFVAEELVLEEDLLGHLGGAADEQRAP